MEYVQTNNLGLIDFWENEQQETGEKERKERKEGRIQKTVENILESSFAVYIRTCILHSKCLRSACKETRSRQQGELKA
jgi:hypothetical protein